MPLLRGQLTRLIGLFLMPTPMTIQQLQKKGAALLDAIEAHCHNAAAATEKGQYAWNRAAAAAGADAYCLREGTQLATIQNTYRGGAAIFRTTAAHRKRLKV